MITGRFLSDNKRPVPEHELQFSSKVKNAWSLNSTHTFAFIALCLIKQTNNLRKNEETPSAFQLSRFDVRTGAS
jgi:hypothetical protein